MKHNERARVAPLYLTLTHPFRTQKIHERPPAAGGRLRRPAATACGFSSRSTLSPPPLNAPRCRSPRYRPPRCRSPRCLLAAACGRLTLRAAARPRRRFHRDQRSARRRAPKRTAHFTCERGTSRETLGVLPTWVPATAMLPLRIVRHLPSCHRRRKRSRESSRPWSVAKRCLANDGEGDLFLVAAARLDAALHAALRHAAAFHDS